MSSIQTFIRKKVVIFYIIVEILCLLFVGEKLYFSLGLFVGVLISLFRFKTMEQILSMAMNQQVQNLFFPKLLRYLSGILYLFFLTIILILCVFINLFLFFGLFAGVILVQIVILFNIFTEVLGITKNNFQ